MAKQQKRRGDAAHIAKEILGYEYLRPGQEAALGDVLTGNDTLAVMPTGSGKSMIYQVAGSIMAGPTIIVSPLIALQRDQAAAIEEQEVGRAAMVNSTERASEIQAAFAGLQTEQRAFLFLAPEQLTSEETLQRLKEAKPSLFVVDEAHCISEWGHDFRPEYLHLGNVIEELGHPRVLALTATASQPVREEILQRLHMHDPRVILRSFDRPNIWLGVEMFQDEDVKNRAVIEQVMGNEKPGIVYAATHKHAEGVARSLRKKGIKVACYHAGMRGIERRQASEAFLHDEVEVMVATNAFGMGIDKPDVRFVFHADIPASVDAYYQEIGRAGRDSKLAKALLFYCPKNLALQQFLAGSAQIPLEQIERVIIEIQEQEDLVSISHLHEVSGLSHTKIQQILTFLEERRSVEVRSTGKVVPMEQATDVKEIAEEVIKKYEAHRHFEQSRLEMMRGYAEGFDCRRRYLLNYFGESFDRACGFCDNCAAGMATEEEKAEKPFPLNSRVWHLTWGEGLVMRYEGEKMTVLFDSVGYKTLSIEIVLKHGLLKQMTEEGKTSEHER